MFSREVRFYEELAREVGEVWFFTYGRDDAQYRDRLDNRIRIFPKHLPVPNLLYAAVLPFLYARELARVDAIRIHQVAGAIPALLAHWMTHKPLIVRAGFQWYSFAHRQGASRLKLWIISIVEALAYRWAHTIIHTTQEDADFVAKRYRIDKDKLHVIPNWIDTELFRPNNGLRHPERSEGPRVTRGPSVASLPQDDIQRQDDMRVCFVGRLEPQKNLLALVEAMRGVDGKLVLYGEGSQRKKLEDTAREHGVDVELCGRIANEDLPAALNACTIFVLPSLYEGNPKVLLEAMACGLPVVGTDVEGITNVIEDGLTGVLCDTDPISIRQAIKRLLDDPALRARLGEAARKSITASCSLEQAIRTETTLYFNTD